MTHQLHQGSAADTADKPQGGGAATPRLKNSPTVAQLRSQLADAALAWAKADRALDAAVRQFRLIHPVLDARIDDPFFRALLDAYDAPEALMAELAAKIEALE